LRVMSGVGIEKFAEWVFNNANEHIKHTTGNRCWVQQVEVWEHEQNSAGVVNITLNDFNQAKKMIENDSLTHVKVEQCDGVFFKAEAPETPQTIDPTTQSSVANPLYAKTSTGWSDPFKGTSWGNK